MAAARSEGEDAGTRFTLRVGSQGSNEIAGRAYVRVLTSNDGIDYAMERVVPMVDHTLEVNSQGRSECFHLKVEAHDGGGLSSNAVRLCEVESTYLEEVSGAELSMLTGATPFRVTLEAHLHYPKTHAANLPLIVVFHGRGPNCRSEGSLLAVVTDENTHGAYRHGCGGADRDPVDQAEQLAYLADALAAQGHVVALTRSGALDAFYNDEKRSTSSGRSFLDIDDEFAARRELGAHYLRWLYKLGRSVEGASNAKQLDEVDFSNIGLIGLSRGGHVAINLAADVESHSNAPFAVRSVVGLAPRVHTAPLRTWPYLQLTPGCDGDVLPHYQLSDFERVSRLAVPVAGATWPASLLLMQGATHEGFAPGATQPDRLFEVYPCRPEAREAEPAGQQQLVVAAVSSWFTSTLHRPAALPIEPFLRGEGDTRKSAWPVWTHPGHDDVSTVGHAYLTEEHRLDDVTPGITRQATTPGFSPVRYRNLMRSEMSYSGFSRVGEVAHGPRGHDVDVMALTPSGSASEAVITAELGRGCATLDASDFDVLSFRITHGSWGVWGGHDDSMKLRVTLKDADGAEAFVDVGDMSHLLYWDAYYHGEKPLNMLQTVRTPLSAFTGVNLAKLTSLELAVSGTSNQLLLGEMLLTH